jgi:DNA-binding transcriptional LysR family regulator
MIDLNEVLVFIKVVDCGSFSEAAKSLGQPRSTVSRKVKQLEASLGTRLLQRSTRKLSLTEAGRQYYLRCNSALSQIEEANNVISTSQQTPSGLLRISAPLSSQDKFMSNFIAEFLSLYKDVSVKINLSDDVVNLIDEGIDVAFRAGNLEDSSLVARKLGNTSRVLCASPQYLKEAAPLKSPKDIKHHDCVIYSHSQDNLNWQLQRGEKTVNVQIGGRIIVNSMQFTLDACLSGLGIALLPQAMVEEYVQSKMLQRVLCDYSAGMGGVYLVYPSKIHLSTTVRAFIDFFIDKWNREPPWKS